MIVYFTCHGETEWNKKGILQGHKDSKLTKKGRLSAERKGKSLRNKNVEIIYSSDLGRCLETSKIINKCLKLKIIKTSKLREMNFGDFNGKPNKKFLKEFDLKDIYKKTPNGESVYEFEKRVKSFIKILSKKHFEKVLLVTHYGVVNTILKYFKEKSKISNKLVYKIKT